MIVLLLALGLISGAARANDVPETQIQVLEALARQDWAGAQTLWQPRAEAGDSEAQYQLGLLFATAPDPYRNRAASRDWLTRAADQSHREAQFRLGMLLAGDTPPDEPGALARFKAAAAAGHALAISEVARREGKSPSFRFALPDPAAARPPDSWSPSVITRAPDLPTPPPVPGRPDAVVRLYPMPPPKPPAPAVTVDASALGGPEPPKTATIQPPKPVIAAPEPVKRPPLPEAKPVIAQAPAPKLAATKPADPSPARLRLAALRDPSSVKPFERDFHRRIAGWRDGLSLAHEVSADGWTRVYLAQSLSAADAQNLCHALKDRQVDCVVVK
jgi:TPR repeat protein